jgi:hypothetical protein
VWNKNFESFNWKKELWKQLVPDVTDMRESVYEKMSFLQFKNNSIF